MTMDLVLEVRKLAWEKGYEVMYLGEFTRIDGSRYQRVRVYNSTTGESFTNSPKTCLEWLRD